MAVSVTPRAYTLLGFRMKKSEADPDTKVEYTEGAVGLTPAKVNLTTGEFDYGSFANFWFVKDNKPVMLNNDGTEAYELDPNDHTKKKDGTASDVSNSSFAGNAMSRIPKVYLKMWEADGYEYCNICDVKLDDDYHAYAHTRADGSEMDYLYLSMFEGSLVANKVRSIKGLNPMNTQTGSNELTYAKANGSGWSTRSWSQRNLINMLLILMGKTTNTQEAFGYGYYTGGSSSAPNYLTTGGASNKGQFYGTNKTRDYVKVFFIENWWGDVWERIEGCVTNSSVRILVINNTLPAEIDSIFPDYSIYPECDYAIGYITRGCPNNCRWCVVPKKEGRIRPYKTWKDLVRQDSDKLVLMDNNILACEYGIEQLEELSGSAYQIDLNQGMDARLVNDRIAEILSRLKWIRFIRFSCDQKSQIEPIKNTVNLLGKYGVRPYRIFVYILVTKNVQDAAERVEALKGYKAINLYAQAERNERIGIIPNSEQLEFQQRYVYGGCYRKETWEEYCQRRKLVFQQEGL